MESYNIIDTMLDLLEVDHTKQYTNKVYNEHPHKNDMYGLYDILRGYGVKAIGVNFTKKDVSYLTFPCILHMQGNFVVASKFSEGKIHYNWNGRELELPFDDFNSVWTGNAIVIDGESDAIEPHIKEHKLKALTRRTASMIFVLAIAYLFALVLHRNNSDIGIEGYLLLSLDGIGLLAAILLMGKLLNKDSFYTDKVCSMFHQKDCNVVLESDKSSIFGISWSEIGFSYFCSHLLVIVAFPSAISTISILDVIVIVYPVWSIYYQWKVVRQWCVLCVSVQLILIAQAIIGFGYLIRHNTSLMISSAMFFGSAFYALLFMVHKYIESCKEKEEKATTLQKLRALKAKPKVFHALIEDEKYNDVSENASSVLFGNPQASIKITILTNPHCNPCARMHKRIEKLLESKGDKLCIQYIFSAFNKQLESSNLFLIAAYQQLGEEKARQIYFEWYDGGKDNADDFISRFRQINVNDISVLKENQKHLAWKQDAGFMATPTILVNGYELPKEYNIEDIKILV